MRRTTSITTALIATAALAAGLAPGASADRKNVTELSCTIESMAVGTPGLTGANLGFVECPRPFGSGLHHNTYTVTPLGMGRGSVAGSFKNYYNRGTTSGTFALTSVATDPMNITFTGTVTYTGGTGRFKHVAGSGTINCSTSDGRLHMSCTVNSRLTGV